MKAVVVRHPGGAEQLTIGEVPTPQPEPGQLLVRVHATALNRADILQRRGLYPPPPGTTPILGLEMAGVVERVGEGCAGWSPGDRVFALLPGGGYVARLYPAWSDFPSGDDAADARRMNAFIEERVLEMPEQYHWLHKRFKTRPPGEPRFY